MGEFHKSVAGGPDIIEVSSVDGSWVNVTLTTGAGVETGAITLRDEHAVDDLYYLLGCYMTVRARRRSEA